MTDKSDKVTHINKDSWTYLDDETRERYEAIEQRVRDKVARGEL